MGKVWKLAMVAAATAVVLSGCGKVAEKATEKVAEKASGCENVDINDKGGSVKCNGNSIDVGGNAQIPAGFPSELKPPSDAKLYSAIKDTSNGNETFNLTMSIPGDPEQVANDFKEQLTKAEYEITDDGVSSGSGNTGGNIRAHNSEWEVTYIFGQNTQTDAKGTYVTQSVRALSADEKDAATSTTEGSGETTTTERTTTTDGSSTASGTDLPAGFPKALDPPKGSDVTAATKSTSNGKTSYYVVANVDGSVEDVYNGLKTQVTDAGFTLVADNLTTSGGESVGSISAKSSQYTLAAVVGTNTSGGGGTTVTLTLAQV